MPITPNDMALNCAMKLMECGEDVELAIRRMTHGLNEWALELMEWGHTPSLCSAHRYGEDRSCMTCYPRAKDALRREDDGTVYAYRCRECGEHWKVYQNPYHAQDCSGSVDSTSEHALCAALETKTGTPTMDTVQQHLKRARNDEYEAEHPDEVKRHLGRVEALEDLLKDL